MIKETKDYTIFKKHVQNRDILAPALDRLVKSIKMKNLLEFRPILVNKKMEVIDGQHRLEAAKTLNLSVFYEVQESLAAEDIYTLNTAQSRFTASDWANFHAKGGNPEYKALVSFMEKYELNLANAMVVIGGGNGMKKMGDSFYKGSFEFPKGEEYLKCINIIDKINIFADFIYRKTPEYKHILNTSSIKRALILFFNIHNVDFDVFMKKLEMKLDLFRRCTRFSDYLEIFAKIYNWKNTANQISIQDLA